MLGLDPLTAGSLLILAGSSAKDLCTPPKPAEINVIPKTKEIFYDNSKTISEIQNVASDTLDPYGFHGMTVTQGFMEGAIRMQPYVKLAIMTYPDLGAACVWYEEIHIPIEIEPKIVVPREVYADRCMKKAVIDHELKHVKVDRQIVNKYAKIMGSKVYEELKKRGFKSGMVKEEDAKDVASRMKKIVFQIVEHEHKKMGLERTERQRDVDSFEEYERVSAQCPQWKNKREDLLRAANKSR